MISKRHIITCPACRYEVDSDAIATCSECGLSLDKESRVLYEISTYRSRYFKLSKMCFAVSAVALPVLLYLLHIHRADYVIYIVSILIVIIVPIATFFGRNIYTINGSMRSLLMFSYAPLFQIIIVGSLPILTSITFRLKYLGAKDNRMASAWGLVTSISAVTWIIMCIVILAYMLASSIAAGKRAHASKESLDLLRFSEPLIRYWLASVITSIFMNGLILGLAQP